MRQKTKTGFTFVELMIAMVILFLAVMVVGSVFPASFNSLLKSKQVTVAATLAQQKLEECLINPRNYAARVGREGNFSPEHPEYSYSITERSVTAKLKELNVEVYKWVNGGKIVDAAVAQLVQQDAAPIIWKVYSDSVSLPNGAWITVLTKNITVPQDGVIKIDAKSGFFNSDYRATNFNMRLDYDGQPIPDSNSTGGSTQNNRTTFGFTTAAINITQGSHAIQFQAYASEPYASSLYPLMIITYHPGIQIQP